MNRRQFLKVVAGVSVTGIAALAVPGIISLPNLVVAPVMLQSQLLGGRLRGTDDGRILESLNGGATWQSVANFGDHCRIKELFEQSGNIYAQVGVQEHSFFLTSGDARLWRTIDSTPQAWE